MHIKKHPVRPMNTVGAEKTFDMLCGKWKIIILTNLYKQDCMRYSEIKKELQQYEISNYMLSKSLEELCNDHLVERTVFPEVPPHVEYSPTPKAIELIRIFLQMTEWYTRYRIQELEMLLKQNS